MNPTGRAGWDPAYREAVLKAVADGSTVREAAANFECSTGSIWRWSRQYGVPKKKGLPPVCHPDRPVLAKRLCGPCYKAKWWRDGVV